MRMLCVLALASLPAFAWGAPAPEKDDNPVSLVEKVRKDLDAPITIMIAKQPLSTAIDALRDKTKLNLVLDGLTIQQQLGFSPDQPPTPVTVDLKDVKARAALRAVLATYGLSYAVLGDTVFVTTEDAAVQRQMRQPVSVDVDKADLAAALKRLGRDVAANVILDSRVEKEAKAAVSLRMENVPLETAVRLLAETAGLKALRVGNTLFVTKKEIAAEMRSDPDIVQLNQPILGRVFGDQAVGGLGTVGTPVITTPVPVPPTTPPAVGPMPAPPEAGPTPPMSRTGSAPPDAKADDTPKPAGGDNAPVPGKKEGP